MLHQDDLGDNQHPEARDICGHSRNVGDEHGPHRLITRLEPIIAARMELLKVAVGDLMGVSYHPGAHQKGQDIHHGTEVYPCEANKSEPPYGQD